MNPHAKRATEIEESFLAGAETNLNQARSGRLRGSQWAWTSRSEEASLRELLVAGRPDRDILDAMPKNRARILTGTQPRWIFWRRRTSVAIASVLSPLEHYIKEASEAPPVGLAELVAHVKDLVGEADVPHLVGVCSPGGFTEDAKNSGLELPNVTLVLTEPRDDGGWNVVATSPDATPEDAKLFDPEAVTQKVKRVREEIESRRADLLTGGLSASAVGERLDLPMKLVTMAFEQAARDEPELKTSRRGREMLLFRGAATAMEDSDMSMMDRLRRLLSGEGDEAKKINALSERRARLAERRDRIYEDLSKLEQQRAEVIQQGKESTSPSARRRIVPRVKQLDRDANRLNATANMLDRQIEVISTHIHNLTLIQQGQAVELPTSEEITEDAVRAEEMLEQLGADVELAGSLSVGAGEDEMADEDLAILAEMEGAPADGGREEARPTSESASAKPEGTSQEEDKEPQRREPEAG